MELYPIGTIVEIADVKLIILGYQQQEHEGKFLNGYIVAQYPIGFTEVDDLKLVRPENIDRVIKEGFKDSELYHKYVFRKDRFFDKTKYMNPERIAKGLEIITENMSVREELNE